MKFTAKVQNPNSVVVNLSIELDLDDAVRLIKQLADCKESLSWPVLNVRRGLESVVDKVKRQITEELVPEERQS